MSPLASWLLALAIAYSIARFWRWVTRTDQRDYSVHAPDPVAAGFGPHAPGDPSCGLCRAAEARERSVTETSIDAEYAALCETEAGR